MTAEACFVRAVNRSFSRWPSRVNEGGNGEGLVVHRDQANGLQVGCLAVRLFSSGSPPFKNVSNPDRRLTIVFAENQKLSFTMPLQREDADRRVALSKKIWSSDKIAIDVNGTLFRIAWASIRKVQIDPSDAAGFLPSPILKGLRMAD
jgi:hypothetical protein